MNDVITNYFGEVSALNRATEDDLRDLKQVNEFHLYLIRAKQNKVIKDLAKILISATRFTSSEWV